MAGAITKVQSIKEIVGISSTGTLLRSYNVAFTVGEQGPFTVTLAGDQFNAANVQKAIQALADEINKIIPGA